MNFGPDSQEIARYLLRGVRLALAAQQVLNAASI
jgi:hypothetical protein